MKNFFKWAPILFYFLLFNHTGYSQNIGFNLLNESITKNANAVVRNSEVTVEMISQRSLKTNVKETITVLNKQGDEFARLMLRYDKNTKVAILDFEYYDVFGKLIKKVKKSDLTDHVAVDGFSLYRDDRLLFYDYIPLSYPYTVYYNYEIFSVNTAFLRDWYPVLDYNVGIEKSSFKFTYPEGFEIQKLAKNFDAFKVNFIEEDQYLACSVENIYPLKQEELSPAFQSIVPSLKLAVNKFHLSGIDGEAKNWEEFGKWMNDKLLSSRNNLNELTRQEIKKMTENIVDPKEKARLVYEYVQNKTRYINVAIGIGGWMPMFTDDVDKLSYGDCKALTFYTKSLLEEVGIPAYYSTVFSDAQKIDIDKELVSVQGNHAFLFLPFENDSIFLECTSQKLPFGLNGNSTQDRDIFTITPEGGKIIHTNKLKPEDNLQQTEAEILLDSKGNIQSTITIKTYGNQLARRLQFDGLQPHDLEKAYKSYFSELNNITFQKIQNKNVKGQNRFEEEFELSASNYGVLNNDGSVIFSPNALNRVNYVPLRETDRKTDFEIHTSFNDIDQVEIEILEGFQVTGLPQSKIIETKFGKYSYSLEQKTENKLLYKRDIIIVSGIYDKEDYEAYRNFRKEIKKYDELKILLTKK